MTTTHTRTHDRFKDAPWYAPYKCVIGGAGGIGSWLTLLIAKLGHHIYLYDHDLVEEHNVGGQLYGINHIGKNKATVMRELTSLLAANPYVYTMGEFIDESFIHDITFSAFDNMKARKLMFDKWLEHQMAKDKDYKERTPEEVNIFIDGRLAAETGIIYCINSPKRAERYKAELFDDSEVPEASCTFRSTSHAGSLIASWMVAFLTNQITNKKLHESVRDVPYKFEFEIPLVMNTEIS